MRRALAAVAAVAALGLVKGITVNQTTAMYDTRACQPPFDALPFCDTTLPIDARVADLVDRIWQNVDWIPPQLTARHETQGQDGPNSNITALGLPAYDYGMNAIHGLQSSCVKAFDGTVYCPTSFPNPVSYGSTWNDTLAWELGHYIGLEARALWLAGATEYNGNPPPIIGLDAWSPNINIARDPRWGRNQEVASEDPFINGNFGKGYTLGIQGGADPKILTVAVTLKHWDAYSLENSDGWTRYNFDANVSSFALQGTYFPAFKASVVEGKAKGVMCSYNAVNGVPTCASESLTSVLRGSWGFDGYITSDSGAINAIFSQHKYVPTAVDAACVAIRDGTCDVNSGSIYQGNLLNITAPGVCPGGEAAINASLARTFKLRMQLGLFDPPSSENPWWNFTMAGNVGTPDAAASSLSAARQAMVLLKNQPAPGAAAGAPNVLPLPTGKKVAIIGPHALAMSVLLGNYLGQLCPAELHVGDFSCMASLNNTIAAANVGGTTVPMVVPPTVTSNDTSRFAAAVALAQASDIVILALGIDGSVEGEMKDRTSIDLPQTQHDLAALVAALQKPTAVVLISGSSLDISAELANANISSILYTGYPGAFGAQAIADTVFGSSTQLGGKLATTWYPASYTDAIAMSNMEVDQGVGRGYRYFTGQPVLPMGFGLAYTTFAFAPVASSATGGWPTETAARAAFRTDAASASALSYSINVANTGAVAGDTVVQAYFTPGAQAMAAAQHGVQGLPLRRQLWGYQRVHLAPGQSQTVSFTATAATLKLVDRASGDSVLVAGDYTLAFEDGAGARLTQEVTMAGPRVVVEPFPGRSQLPAIGSE